MKISYRWMQEEYFKDKLPKPDDLVESVTLQAFEVEDVKKNGSDYILDIDVLPNRAHDCYCHRGLSKDIGVVLGLPFSEKEVPKVEVDKELDSKFSVSVKDAELCPRYAGRLVENIKVGPSPAWLKERIESIGQRSINNVVDATNYMLFNYGQPVHAFDVDKLDNASIIVRRAKRGEKMTTLDEKDVELDDTMLIIADANEPVAVAGVKGGVKAEVNKKTKDILIEVANFEAVQVRKTSRKIGVLTDASSRYEHEISPELVGEVMERVTALIVDVAGDKETKVSSVQDRYGEKQPEYKIEVTLEKINKLLGVELTVKEISDILERFDFEYTQKDGAYSVVAPPQRLDLRIPENIIEEVGRIYAYENIEGKMPKVEGFTARVHKKFYYLNTVRDILTKAGFSEVMTYSFVDEGAMELENPLSQDKPKLRDTLIHGVVNALELNIKNIDLLGIDDVRIFEIGQVFESFENEYTNLAIGVQMPKTKKSEGRERTVAEELLEDLLEKLGGQIEHVEKVGEDGGIVLEMNITKLLEELSEPKKQDVLLSRPASNNKYKTVSIYPFIVRDIAVWVPGENSKEDLETLLKNRAGELLVREPRLFDEYTKKTDDGETKTSYAYKLIFQSLERTLTDEEVNKIMENIYSQVGKKKGWEVR